MATPSDSTTLRSSTSPARRSKRSTTNLANLRLAPLSEKFTDTGNDSGDFVRPSSIAYSSAPNTPGGLSRSSSRRHFDSVGWSDRTAIGHEDVDDTDGERTRAGAALPSPSSRREQHKVESLRTVGVDIPKAHSEAALQAQGKKLAGRGEHLRPSQQQQRTPQHHVRRRTGGSTTVAERTRVQRGDDWLTRAGEATSAIVQASKVHSSTSFIPSRKSTASFPAAAAASMLQRYEVEDYEEDEDDGYEELAVASAHIARSQFADDELSPVSTRGPLSGWGSRYGSRAASRRTSRRGSFAAPKTPLAGLQVQRDGAKGVAELPIAPDFVDDDEDDGVFGDSAGTFAFGGWVDRLVGINLFHVEERDESGDERQNVDVEETETEALARREAVNRRKKEEKERLTQRSRHGGNEGHSGGTIDVDNGWKQDAAWLWNAASKAMFS